MIVGTPFLCVSRSFTFLLAVDKNRTPVFYACKSDASRKTLEDYEIKKNVMNLEEEILKEEKLREKRIRRLTIFSLIFLGAAIAVSLSFQSKSPLVVLVLVPLIVGASLGFILSILSIRLSYETSVRLIKIETVLHELRNNVNETPIIILQKRLVRGEMSKEEYNRLSKEFL